MTRYTASGEKEPFRVRMSEEELYEVTGLKNVGVRYWNRKKSIFEVKKEIMRVRGR